MYRLLKLYGTTAVLLSLTLSPALAKPPAPKTKPPATTRPTKPNGKTLLEAIKKDQTDRALKLIAQGVNLKTEDEGDTYLSPLQLAIAKNNIAVVRALLNKGISALPENENELAPILFACESATVPMIQLLLEHGATFAADAETDFNPLVDAIVGKKPDIIRFLIDKGADLRQPSASCHSLSPLTAALAMGNLTLATELLNKGVPLESADDIRPVLHIAVINEQPESVRFLLAHSIPVDQSDNSGYTALMLAAKQNNPEVVRLLLENKADTSKVDDRYRNALYYAQESEEPNHKKIVALLTGAGAKASTSDLFFAVANSRAQLEDLLKSGADPNTRDAKGRTVLHAAVNLRVEGDMIQLLLENGANPNARDAQGHTVLQTLLAESYSPAEAANLLIFAGAESPELDLFDAITNGDQVAITALLAKGVTPNVRNTEGETPLLAAIDRRDFATINLLLEKGAGINIATNGGETPLLRATSRGDAEMVRLLLEKGAEPNLKTEKGTPLTNIAVMEPEAQEYLHIPSFKSSFDAVARLLIDHGADIRLRPSKDSDSPLHSIAADGSTELLREVLDKGAQADINSRARYDYTPLMEAAFANRVDNVKLLLDRGADAELVDDFSSHTALMHAAEDRGDRAKISDAGLEITRVLLDYGAKTDHKDKRGRTALMLAEESGNDATAKLIRAAGGKRVELEPNRALQEAARQNDFEAVKRAVARGADVNFEDKEYFGTPLGTAAYQNNIAMVTFLLEKGADINQLSKSGGSTALTNAIEYGSPALVRFLLKKGAKIELSVGTGTPLMMATLKDRVEMMRLLLDSGASMEQRDDDGMTVLMRAAMKSSPETVRFLLARKANIHAVSNGGQTALMWAAVTNSSEVVELLLNAGAKVNVSDKDGQTPLIYATLGRNLESIRLLLAKNADTRKTNNRGKTALDIAREYDNRPIIQLLMEAGKK